MIRSEKARARADERARATGLSATEVVEVARFLGLAVASPADLAPAAPAA